MAEMQMQAHGEAAHTEHAHPSPRVYVKVALFLAAITAVEVAISYAGLPKFATISLLFVLSAVKFFMVASFFMHLRFDSRVFTMMFVGGLTLAFIVFIAVLAIQRVLFV